jgi:N-acetylmuramoyl-L-alanine amidase
MRKKLIILGITAFMSLLSTITPANASYLYDVKSGDSLWLISKKHGVSLSSLRSVNNIYDSLIHPGEKLTIPTTLTAEEKDLLARLVRAEAVGEPYAGKVAVATVVFNRVDSELFPNTIKDVIYEISAGGYYAFSPVQNGQINKAADNDSLRAVEEAIAFRGQGKGSIYFYNPETAKSKWILSREVTVQIGDHVFAK